MITEVLQLLHRNYRVERGRLVPVGDVRAQFNPLNGKRAEQLATEFAKLHDGDVDGLRRFARAWGLLGWAAIEVRDKADEGEAVKGGDTAEGGRTVIAGILNPNLLYTRLGLRSYIDSKSLLIKQDCIYLLAAIYWQLARIVAERQVARCSLCEGIFVVTEQRQKYCPPARGRSESICAARARKRGQKEEPNSASKVEEEE